MSYRERVGRIIYTARKNIKQAIDESKSNEIILIQNTSDMDDDEWTSAVKQDYANKYGTNETYFITKVYKEGTSYYAEGENTEDGSTYTFDLEEELDWMTIIDLEERIP